MLDLGARLHFKGVPVFYNLSAEESYKVANEVRAPSPTACRYLLTEKWGQDQRLGVNAAS